MKVIIIILFISLCMITNGQGKIIVYDKKNNTQLSSAVATLIKSKPLVFIDSVKVPYEMLTQISPNDIQEVNVVKNGYDSISKTEGKIYLKLKKGADFKLFNFAALKAKYFSNSKNHVLLLKNGQFVNQYNSFYIDDNAIAKVEINEGADVESLKRIYSNNTIVNILTKQAFNTNSTSQIILNGLPTNGEPQ